MTESEDEEEDSLNFLAEIENPFKAIIIFFWASIIRKVAPNRPKQPNNNKNIGFFPLQLFFADSSILLDPQPSKVPFFFLPFSEIFYSLRNGTA